MHREPRIEIRPERRYVAVRAVLAMRDFDHALPAMTAQVSRWLAAKGLRPAGPPFVRYRVVDMPDRMDVELGVPGDAEGDPAGEVQAQVLPAGRYAVLAYTGVRNGVPANQRLVDWIVAQGEEAASHASEQGEVFAARCETYLTDTEAEPDQDRWDIEVAIQLRGAAMAPPGPLQAPATA